MSVKQLALLGDTSVSINATENATANYVALRDASGNCAFAQLTASELKSTGILTLAAPVTKTTAFTVDATSTMYICDATAGSFAVTLLAASSVPGRVYIFKKKNSANTVTPTGAGSENIDGANTSAMTTQYSVLRIISDGTQYWSF